MASNVIVKESSMVYPASETPNHTITLPSLDTTLRLPNSHTLHLYIYTPKTQPPFKNNVLQSSLSNILVPFYPLAGRLTRNPKNNHLEITCNAMGVLFVEAETINHGLDHFGEFTPSHALREVTFPPPCDYTKGISTFPLLMVQVTRFRCGGVTLGLMVHHSVQDGFAVAQFVNSWSRLVRGLDLADVWPPCHDRINYLGPRQPPLVMFRHFEYEPPVELSDKSVPCSNDITTCNLFKFSKFQINTLKNNPMLKQLKQKPSTYAILAAHLWRCVTKARSLPYDQEVRLYTPVNGRSRLKKPSLPKGYFGNVLFRGVCIAKAGDIVSQPLFCTTDIVQEAITRMDNEYLRSAIDYLAINPSLTCLNPSLTWIQQESSPNLSINSWFGIPFSEADFGLGGPTWVRLGGVGYEGQTTIMPSTNGDGSLSVSINLSIPHMNIFKNYIYHFVEILPSL